METDFSVRHEHDAILSELTGHFIDVYRNMRYIVMGGTSSFSTSIIRLYRMIFSAHLNASLSPGRPVGACRRAFRHIIVY